MSLLEGDPTLQRRKNCTHASYEVLLVPLILIIWLQMVNKRMEYKLR